MFGLRIVVGDQEEGARKSIKDMLKRAGHSVIAEAGDGRTLSQQAFNRSPDLVIADALLPLRDGFEVARVLDEQRVAPVILVMNEDYYWVSLDKIKETGIYGCLVRPLSEVSLLSQVEIAWACFQRIRRLEEDNRKIKETLENRKIIDRAKGLLMEQRGLSEQEAFRLLRKASMDRCLSLEKIAKAVIKGEI
ncbi:MAG: ANTAR domain-containing response regulator [Bacillota bacterium]